MLALLLATVKPGLLTRRLMYILSLHCPILNQNGGAEKAYFHFVRKSTSVIFSHVIVSLIFSDSSCPSHQFDFYRYQARTNLLRFYMTSDKINSRHVKLLH